MAIAERTGEETLQMQVVCVDELVPDDDLLRRVEALVDWGAVRATARPFYSEIGRPGVDPAVLVKLFLTAALRGQGSMRETLRGAALDLSVRRFLGYGLTEALPHHSTLSHAQCVRFASSSVFEQLFTQVLARCREAGLLDGTRLVLDATHVEANAALRSLRAELEPVAGEADEQLPSEDSSAAAPPPLALTQPRSGPTPKRKATNATALSRSDPNAKLRHKPGQRPHLVHRAQVATDPKARVIVAVRAEQATGGEADSIATIIERARWARHSVAELCADQGYASEAVYGLLAGRGVTAYIPPQPRMRHPAAVAARRRSKSPPGVSAAIDRMTHGEGAIAELKNQHGLGRARCRGTPKLQVQLLLAATAVNLKRLVSRSGAAAGAATGGGEAIAAQIAIITTCLDWLRRLDAGSSSTAS